MTTAEEGAARSWLCLSDVTGESVSDHCLRNGTWLCDRLSGRAELPEGDAWPTDEPGFCSADYMYGAAGSGHYFLRLQRPHDIEMPFM